jgi:hypothetical protein
MKFASCRINNGKLLICSFTKEYNKCIFEKTMEIDFNEAREVLKEFDHLDMVVPGRDVFYYSRNYPPVNENQLRKIVAQDIESDTPFKEGDLIVEVKTAPLEPAKVFCLPKNSIRGYLENFDQSEKEKIRAMIPEEYLAFKCLKGIEKSIFIGDDYSFLITETGKVVRSVGINDLKKDLVTLFAGENPQEDMETWLKAGIDISSGDELSDIELRIRKSVSTFFEKTFSYFISFAGNPGETSVFIGDIVPEGTEKLVKMMDSSSFSDKPFTVVGYKESLEMAGLASERGSTVNFAKGEFAYKGGFMFLKKRIILGAVLYIAGLMFLVSGMQVRISYLNKRAALIDERTRTVMVEVLGREYPSLRQAISVMNQTIRGEEGAADRRTVYPYSALNIMENIFPLIAYEGSSIEISEMAIREEGKVRIAGTAASLDDINKLTENLNGHGSISDLSRGQINTRGEQSSFNITFDYAQPKKPDTKSQKSRKKGSN